jgi:hypothetical protein
MTTLLENLFNRQYPIDGAAKLNRFRTLLGEAKLEIDVESSMTEHNVPPTPDFPYGLPSFIYYYVYGTQFGSVKKIPAGAGESAHAFSSDGIGLNMGCPIRFFRALEVLFSLKPEDQKEPLAHIRARKNHFSCVEELLWLTLWKQQTEVGRGGPLLTRSDGTNPSDVDWFFISIGTPIYLEVKFRQTDWMRKSDCGGAVLSENFFGAIGHKFPSQKSALQKCLAAITGYVEPITDNPDADSNFLVMCERKLLSTPGLDAILYRTLLGPIYIFSLDKSLVSQIAALIRYPEITEYPINYPVVFNLALRNQRAAQEKRVPNIKPSRICFAIVPDNEPSPISTPKYPYRCDIPKRGRKGEPSFQDIPPFLKPAPDSSP